MSFDIEIIPEDNIQKSVLDEEIEEIFLIPKDNIMDNIDFNKIDIMDEM